MNRVACKRCVMDSHIPNISFDEEGICNYCRLHDNLEKQYPFDGTQMARLEKIVDKMKEDGKGKEYDCVIGVSGGCDSSFLMHTLSKMGVRLLAITFDNTWSSDIAVENIHNIITKLNIDLWTYVVDSDEFDDISRSFLKASVPDADVPNDIAIAKLYYMAMDKYDLEYAICGHSFRTEGTVPLGWTYMDGMYIKSVHEMFGTIPMKTFPNLDLDYWLDHLKNKKEKRIRAIYYLDYMKEDAKKLLANEYGWRWYGGHHFENEFTKFVKSYLLPVKFNIDKRYVEFSALVRSGQKRKEEALEELKTLPEVDPVFVKHVQKRLGFSDAEFQEIMNAPIKSYMDYPNYKQYFRENKAMFKEMLDQGLISETFYMKYTKE